MRETVFRSLPWVVLVVCLAFTHDAWREAEQDAERARLSYFDGVLRDTTAALVDRLDSYRDALLGGAGLFNASEEVTREEWREFQLRLQLPVRHPGAQGLGYAVRVPPGQLPATESRLGEAVETNGRDHAQLPLREHFVIRYTDPNAASDRNVGFDVASVGELRRAMERARDTGETTLSERVAFDVDGTPEPIFVMFTPVYEGGRVPETLAERTARIEGWVYAPFIARSFVRGLLDTLLKEDDPLIELSIYSSPEPDPRYLLFSDVTPHGEEHDIPPYSGMSRIDVYGESWSLVVNGDDPHAFFDRRREAWAVLATGLVTSLLMFGVVRWLNERRRQAVALAAAMTDDLVARARDLRRSNAELAVARDRAEAAATTLLEQHESLARAERLAALGEMAASLAHELRNPIAGMMTSLENLQRETGEPHTKERLELVTAEMQRLTRLLGAYLAPVRHRPERIENVDVTRLVEQLCALVRFRIPETVSLDCDHGAPLSWPLPRDRMRQALLNLVLNAQQAIQSLGADARGHIDIRIDVVDDDLCVTVEDDGPGFPAETLEHGSQPFQTSRSGGTGLGLAMVRRVVRDLDGRLELSNREPHGACVRLVLPRRELSAAPGPECSEPAAPAQGPDAARGSQTSQGPDA
jgi:signal transduction histidine kinase